MKSTVDDVYRRVVCDGEWGNRRVRRSTISQVNTLRCHPLHSRCQDYFACGCHLPVIEYTGTRHGTSIEISVRQQDNA